MLNLEPFIEEFPEDAHITEGESVFFRVKVSGFPKPALSWYHDGVEVQADYSTELKEDGSLAINSSEPRHTGVYQMVAKNEAGSTEKAVTLYVNAEGGATPAVQKKTVVLQAIPVAEFGEHVARGHASTNRGLRDQYNVRTLALHYTRNCMIWYCRLWILEMSILKQLVFLLQTRSSTDLQTLLRVSDKQDAIVYFCRCSRFMLSALYQLQSFHFSNLLAVNA